MFSSVYVAAYYENLGENANKMLAELRRGALPPEDGLTASDFRQAWGYQFDDIPEGAWLIDLNCRSLRKVKVLGCSQATGLRLQPDGETVLTIALRRPVTINGKRFPISASEKASLTAAARKIATVGYGLVPLVEVIKMIDRKK